MPEKVNGGNGDGGPEKGTERRKNGRDLGSQGKMWFEEQGENRADRCSARNAKHIRIGKRIAQQRLETGSGDRERCAHERSQQDARQAQIQDEAVFGRNVAALAEENAKQIADQAIKRKMDGAELERHNHHAKENDRQDKALQQKTADSQRPHQFFSFCGEAGRVVARSRKASGCNWRARSSTAENKRGAGRFMASLITTNFRFF